MLRTLATFIALMSGVIQVAAEDFPSYPDHLTSQIQEEALDGGLGAADTQPRILLGLALELIKVFEAWVPVAYNDASVFCTIGYGHLIGKKPCTAVLSEIALFDPPLTEAEGSVQLEKDTALARVAVQRLVKESLNDEQFGALTSFVFNVGSANFESSTMLRYLNNNEFDGAAKQFARWTKSKGKVLNGLVARRNCETQLFLGNAVSDAIGKFNREICDSSGAAPPSEELIDIDVGEN